MHSDHGPIQGGRMRPAIRALLLAAIAALCLLGGPARAHAATLPGPSSMALGLSDAGVFETASPATQSFWLGRAQAIGSSFVRLEATWSAIAPAQPASGFDAGNPADPQYRWSGLDTVVRAASAHDQTVVLLAYAAPTWASGPDRPSSVNPALWDPNAADFGAFAHALAQRYSGHFPDPLRPGHDLPRVRYFQAWNEPNLPDFMLPQWAKTSKGWQAVSPGIYRNLLNAFYAGVKEVQPSSTVLAAGTAPYGDPPGTGLGRMAPVTFLDGLLCVSSALRPAPCPNPAHFDALDHHPYSLAPTLPASSPADVSLADLNKIWRILRAAERFHRALPAGPKSLWVTEIHWSSTPPSSAAVQARFLARGLYVLWRQDVSHVIWFYVRDTPGSDGDGLYTAGGEAKPVVAVFRFPFLALPAPHHGLTVWGRAPHPGKVKIEQLTGGRWRSVLTVRTTAGGIFYAVSRLGSSGRFRAVSRGAVSPAWSAG